jgi:periplasmic protein TonB
MFGDTLLESSSASGKRKRWPMATAFTLELIIAGIVVLIPLFSTGVISVSAWECPTFTPAKPMAIERVRPVRVDHSRPDGLITVTSRAPFVLANNNKNTIYLGPPAEITTDPKEATPPGSYPASRIPSELINSGASTASVKPGDPKRVISQLTEAQLLNRVEPAYPRIAVVSGVQGQVRLHAIIARDGTIQSLNVISGHPLLASAALDAVRQWRYRPYLLNGEAVEVETFITVNFRKDMR